ncbi:hypothetical protein Nocox_38440 [Nonomuraea coxensis DSM 45129]|uniref:DUF397 domain-containing protein n=1 Tax=Nonomuraea coxensis DSM 45129 TaxID=1122611 RepID=A0ABX8UF63_9ACTN|nr:DUF397 domain-containing protein [Nonomuraea coxensis]QYC45238.1 hypothetical protein Nocox_38440 [Nonomuraea coxensis DSM 45129]
MNEATENKSQSTGWFKATFSDNGGGCVEVAFHADLVLVRDSKDPHGPVLRFTVPEWDAFLCGVYAGEFDQE